MPMGNIFNIDLLEHGIESDRTKYRQTLWLPYRSYQPLFQLSPNILYSNKNERNQVIHPVCEPILVNYLLGLNTPTFLTPVGSEETALYVTEYGAG